MCPSLRLWARAAQTVWVQLFWRECCFNMFHVSLSWPQLRVSPCFRSNARGPGWEMLGKEMSTGSQSGPGLRPE